MAHLEDDDIVEARQRQKDTPRTKMPSSTILCVVSPPRRRRAAKIMLLRPYAKFTILLFSDDASAFSGVDPNRGFEFEYSNSSRRRRAHRAGDKGGGGRDGKPNGRLAVLLDRPLMAMCRRALICNLKLHR